MRYGIPVLACLVLLAAPLAHAQITTFSDRPTFDAAVGPTTLETFTNSDHFPISSGILNSATNEVVAVGTPILPGDIQPGVTYSRPVGTSFFFNIDAGGGFTGGFLDGFTQTTNTPLTVTFDGPVAAFGFDTNTLMGSAFDIMIQHGTTYTNTFGISTDQFFGFQSSAPDITSLTILGNGGSFAFALDNFAFTPVGTTSSVPEPGSMALLIGMGISGAGFLARRKRIQK